jgi:cytochrome c peroxidase
MMSFIRKLRWTAAGILAVGFAFQAASLALQPADSDVPTTRPARATRPVLDDDAYERLADELRAAYVKPPADWPKPQIDPEAKFAELGLLPPVEHPNDNPFTKEKAELGKQLFFDPRLSGSKQIACASCHDPDLAWADGRTAAFGHDRQVGQRNTPSIMNAAYQSSQFWDGRVYSLESQARMPIVNEIEMHSSPDAIAAAVNDIAGYRAKFLEIFGVEEVDFDVIAKAIACFERTITSGERSDFDKFLKGDAKALSDSAVRGLHLFRTAARCINCHNGPNFSDGQFHNIGLTYYGRKFEDLGRYVVTKDSKDVGKFRTPGLRNVSRTGPLMHNGFFELDGVLNLYNAGGPKIEPKNDKERVDPKFPVKSPLIKPLGLNQRDLADLKAFLESLEVPKLRVRAPELP